MTNTPKNLQDANELLTNDGFTVGSVWYHGTSSTLAESIKEQGLKRSGDKAIKQTAKKIMATIGNSYKETIEPVFLTQSKELAYYWATQKVKERAAHTGEEETPMVFSVKLPKEINTKVKPDVGAASLLLVEGNNFLDYLAELYLSHGFEKPMLDPLKSDRLDYLNKLGMAYIDSDINLEYLEVSS